VIINAFKTVLPEAAEFTIVLYYKVSGSFTPIDRLNEIGIPSNVQLTSIEDLSFGHYSPVYGLVSDTYRIQVMAWYEVGQ
jgi:hypothetical protein